MLHIHSPPILERRIVRSHCPVCERRTFFYGWFQEWYGWHETCLNCGDNWQDGEMCPRPFMRAWRKESIRDAKRAWRKHRTVERTPSHE